MAASSPQQAPDAPGEPVLPDDGAPRGAAGPAGLLLALGVFGALAWRFSFLIDDAFISFRYAENWARGHGLRFNLADEPPVEGFSNFLWVCLLALSELASVPLEFSSRLFSCAAGVGVLVLFHRLLTRRMRLPAGAAFAGTLVLATFPPMAIWATSGLETMGYVLSLFGLYLCLCGRGDAGEAPGRGAMVAAALCAICASTLRVEGIAWALILPALTSFSYWRRGASVRGLAGGLALYAVVLGAVCAALLAARYSYYGDWVANTVHAKAVMSGDTILRGLKTTATFYLTVFLGLFATFLAVPAALKPRDTHLFVAGQLTLGFLAYHVLVGGDWMPMFRFLVPAAPYMAILIAVFVARRAHHSPRPYLAPALGVGLALVNLIPLVGVIRQKEDSNETYVAAQIKLVPEGLRKALYFRKFKSGYETEIERWWQTSTNTEKYEIQGKALALIAEEGDSFVTGPIGAMGFYSRIHIYDRNGLVNREVAMLDPDPEVARSAGHDKRVSRSFFLDRKPRFLRLAWVEEVPKGPQAPRFIKPLIDLLRAAMQDDADDRELYRYCRGHLYPLLDQPGLPPEMTLFTLEFCEDEQEALRTWANLGYRPAIKALDPDGGGHDEEDGSDEDEGR